MKHHMSIHPCWDASPRHLNPSFCSRPLFNAAYVRYFCPTGAFTLSWLHLKIKKPISSAEQHLGADSSQWESFHWRHWAFIQALNLQSINPWYYSMQSSMSSFGDRKIWDQTLVPATSAGKWAWVRTTFPVGLSQKLSRNSLVCLFSFVYIPPASCFGFHAALECSCWSKLESPVLWHPECCWGQPAWAMGCLQGQAAWPKSRLWDVKSPCSSTRYLLTVLRCCMKLLGEKKKA